MGGVERRLDSRAYGQDNICVGSPTDDGQNEERRFLRLFQVMIFKIARGFFFHSFPFPFHILTNHHDARIEEKTI